jgi:hypothetical protein
VFRDLTKSAMIVQRHAGDQVWDEPICLKLQFMREDVDWIHLTQDRTKRRAPVNTVMNLSDNYLLKELVT